MLKKIFLDSGHSNLDPGTTTIFGNETDFNRQIRDALIPELKRCGFEVLAVPDDLDLVNSYLWVNKIAKNLEDGLALAIHCNCCGREGAESYYFGSSMVSKLIAQQLLNEYCKETGFINLGARSDTSTRFGELSWIRETNCWATLLECGFLDNLNDVEKLKDFKKIVRGICKGVCRIYNIDYIEEFSQPKSKEEIKREIISLLNQL